ncbi:DNA-binding MarR family transcriptional regulator [Arthrobacter stackebrandtii]|uniref:DNA-binding MarR family transcriptional regulator n=1 Tax=Arthrobacter stackebrandtii TaxID=272161 RepID=A0ABS4YRB8_9MICC|nr:MarR family winged helix-turn-helix transcriptional regulator [Arthrobacter stackebrandtii]MBP2411324.1 DNA-binding MarR family transcriptional regulator [Arthrobacter stackebrandtii]
MDSREVAMHGGQADRPVPEPQEGQRQGPEQRETRWLSAQEQAIWLELREFAKGLPRAIDRQLLQDSDVSGVEYAVLAVISEAGCEQMRSGDLAAQLGWDRSRVSHLLKRMESRGLLHRCTASADGRGQDISLTDSGWEKIRSAAPGHVTMVRETIFDPLKPDQQAQLFEALTSIRRAAEERGLW